MTPTSFGSDTETGEPARLERATAVFSSKLTWKKAFFPALLASAEARWGKVERADRVARKIITWTRGESVIQLARMGGYYELGYEL